MCGNCRLKPYSTTASRCPGASRKRLMTGRYVSLKSLSLPSLIHANISSHPSDIPPMIPPSIARPTSDIVKRPAYPRSGQAMMMDVDQAAKLCETRRRWRRSKTSLRASTSRPIEACGSTAYRCAPGQASIAGMSFRREPRSWPRRGFCVVKSSQSGKQSHPEIVPSWLTPSRRVDQCGSGGHVVEPARLERPLREER